MTERIFSEATIRLAPDHVQLAKDVSVGSRVRIVLFGTVKEIQLQANESIDDKAMQGRLELSVSSVKSAISSEIADLFEDELGG